MSSFDDTIFALSSGALPSGVAVIRLTGPSCCSVLEQIGGSVPAVRQARLRRFRAPDGETLDHGLALFFPGPESATGEDCAELHCHGGRTVVAAILRTISKIQGCRPAEPGEFTRRAFVNGRYDLVQVEALADLIDAETESQRRLAVSGFDGHASSLYQGWRERLTGARAYIEATLDFSDEGDVPADISQVWEALQQLSSEMERHVAGGRASEIVRDGFRVIIMGPPNAGKSSLLNALADRDVAIVTDEPGTTRDLVEVALEVDGRKVIVTDTAGIREQPGRVEAIGIERARQAARASDLVIWLDAADSRKAQDAPADAVRLVSKADLLPDKNSPPTGSFSVRTGEGLDAIIGLIEERLRSTPASEGIAPVRLRHEMLARECHQHLRRAIESDEMALELKAECLRMASHSLGRIVGAVDVEDLLNRIFGTFCIGK